MRRAKVVRHVLPLRLPARSFGTLNELVVATGLNASQVATLVIRTASKDWREGKESRLVTALRAAASSSDALEAKSTRASFSLTETVIAELSGLATSCAISNATALAVMLDAIALAYGGGGGGQKPLGSGDMDPSALLYIIYSVPPPSLPERARDAA